MIDDRLAIFALKSSHEFGENVCSQLKTSLSLHEEHEFEDGEHKARPLVNVRGKDVFVIQSLHGDSRHSVNDKLCRLLFFIGALRDASADRITAVVPYLCYARKDRKTKSRDPVTTRYVAALFEAVGADSIVTLDVHNLAAFQNAFRIQTDHLEARQFFVRHFASSITAQEIVVVSPDSGGVKRAEDFRQSLNKHLGCEITSAFVEKYRSGGLVSGQALVGNVAGKTAIIIDDLISGGTTMVRAAEACISRGATAVFAAATHGVFNERTAEILSGSHLSGVVITNSVPVNRMNVEGIHDRLSVLDIAPLFAESITRIHSGGSIVDLLET